MKINKDLVYTGIGGALFGIVFVWLLLAPIY